MFSKIRVSSRGLVINNGQILLNKFNNGIYYNIPGGGVEPGETAKEAVQREVYEESGLMVRAEKLIFFFDYEPIRNKNSSGNIHHMSTVFMCRIIGDANIDLTVPPELNPDDPTITGRAEWVKFDDIPNINLVPEINKELYRLVSGRESETEYLIV